MIFEVKRRHIHINYDGVQCNKLCTIVMHYIRQNRIQQILSHRANFRLKSRDILYMIEKKLSKCVFCQLFLGLETDGGQKKKDQLVEVKLNIKGGYTDEDAVNIVGMARGSRQSFIWTQTGQAYRFGKNFYAQLGYGFHRADSKEH